VRAAADLGRITAAGLLAAALAVVGLAGAPPRDAQADFCFYPVIKGAGPSIWTPDLGATGVYYSGLYSRSLGAYRDAGSDFEAMQASIGGNTYDTDSDDGCKSEANGREWSVPQDPSFGGTDLTARAKIYGDNRRPFARSLLILHNPTAAPIEFDLLYDNTTGAGDESKLDRSSNAPKEVSPADIWATSCDDPDDDGCTNSKGEKLRSPELAFNWEVRGGSHEGADDAVFSGENLTVSFEDVTIGPGKTKSFLQLVTMSLNAKGARRAADLAARNPGSYGVFRGLSKKERKRVVNW
jgi:hypothetical protein